VFSVICCGQRSDPERTDLKPVALEAVPAAGGVSNKERVRVSKRFTSLEPPYDVNYRQVPTVVRAESGRLAALVAEGVVFLDDAGKQQLVFKGDDWYSVKGITIELGDSFFFWTPF